MVLKLSATERTWLSISSGGKEIFAGTLQPSESKTLTGLLAGPNKGGQNRRGLNAREKGKTIPSVGARERWPTKKIPPKILKFPPKRAL